MLANSLSIAESKHWATFPSQQSFEAIPKGQFGQQLEGKEAYLDNVIGLNKVNFRAQQKALNSEVRKERAGVQVRQVK